MSKSKLKCYFFQVLEVHLGLISKLTSFIHFKIPFLSQLELDTTSRPLFGEANVVNGFVSFIPVLCIILSIAHPWLLQSWGLMEEGRKKGTGGFMCDNCLVWLLSLGCLVFSMRAQAYMCQISHGIFMWVFWKPSPASHLWKMPSLAGCW